MLNSFVNGFFEPLQRSPATPWLEFLPFSVRNTGYKQAKIAQSYVIFEEKMTYKVKNRNPNRCVNTYMNENTESPLRHSIPT